jgi:hypothetical protein
LNRSSLQHQTSKPFIIFWFLFSCFYFYYISLYTRNGIFVCFSVSSLTLRGIKVLRILNLFFVGLLLLCLVDTVFLSSLNVDDTTR